MSYNVLVIDDNEGDQFLCQHAINQYKDDVNITEAYDGQQALEILETLTPDLIFLDISMPRMGGFEFLEHYQDRFGQRQTKIVMLTSSMVEKDLIRCKAFTVVGQYVQKPLKTDNLIEAMANSA